MLYRIKSSDLVSNLVTVAPVELKIGRQPYKSRQVGIGISHEETKFYSTY